MANARADLPLPVGPVRKKAGEGRLSGIKKPAGIAPAGWNELSQKAEVVTPPLRG